MRNVKRKIAVVHDFLYCYAGAERVLEQIINVFPDADLFSLFDFLPEGERQFIKDKPVHCSFIQRLPFARTRHRSYLPLMPLAIEQLDLSDYDLVISSSYLAAKGILTRPDQLHVCYCHSPVRFAWDLQHQYLNEAGLTRGLKSIFARMLLHYIRNWDARSAQAVDVFVTNSNFVSRRVEKLYRRSSTTIHPPVDIEQFSLHRHKEDHYVTVSRLVSYKRVDLIVEAFNRMPDRRLYVIGDGPDYRKIAAKAGPNVTMLGHQTFEQLRHYLQTARAFVFAAEEDFGIVPLEAQACGTPVIAYGRGGSLETVVDGLTGILFGEQTSDSIIRAVNLFEQDGIGWDPDTCRRNATRFSPARFRHEFRELVEQSWETFIGRRETQAANNRRSAAMGPQPNFSDPIGAEEGIGLTLGRAGEPEVAVAS